MKNVLTNLNSHKLYSFLDENRETAQSCTAKVLAEVATAELGFAVTENNMDNARRESGIVVNAKREDTTKADIVVLANALRDLYNYSGFVCPQQTVEVCLR